MPTFAVNMKHTAESCPLFNAEVKKRLKEMLGKREDVWDRANKHGVHVLGFGLQSWTILFSTLLKLLLKRLLRITLRTSALLSGIA